MSPSAPNNNGSVLFPIADDSYDPNNQSSLTEQLNLNQSLVDQIGRLPPDESSRNANIGNTELEAQVIDLPLAIISEQQDVETNSIAGVETNCVKVSNKALEISVNRGNQPTLGAADISQNQSIGPDHSMFDTSQLL